LKRKFDLKFWCIILLSAYDPITVLDEKEELLKELEKIANDTSIKKAKEDFHANRIPRSCGITVHPGLGCPNNCLYCYLIDFGSKFQDPKPYRLNGFELCLSLLYNKWFVPGKMGTFIAVGSVCEPFHPIFYKKTIDYLKSFAKYLENPLQISTKMFLNADQVHEIIEAVDRQPLNPLVTIITIKEAKKLEPNAPPPDKRFETISNLRDAGLKPVLFLRPIIPEITDKELEQILESASDAGAAGVVVGSLRISRKILKRLKKTHVNLHSIKKRITKIKQKQIYLKTTDLKEEALKIAKEFKLLPFRSACCANAFNAAVLCANVCWTTKFCTNCPNNCKRKEINITTEKINQTIKRVLNIQSVNMIIHNSQIKVTIPKNTIKNLKIKPIGALTLLKTLLRKKIKITYTSHERNKK